MDKGLLPEFEIFAKTQEKYLSEKGPQGDSPEVTHYQGNVREYVALLMRQTDPQKQEAYLNAYGLIRQGRIIMVSDVYLQYPHPLFLSDDDRWIFLDAIIKKHMTGKERAQLEIGHEVNVPKHGIGRYVTLYNSNGIMNRWFITHKDMIPISKNESVDIAIDQPDTDHDLPAHTFDKIQYTL